MDTVVERRVVTQRAEDLRRLADQAERPAKRRCKTCNGTGEIVNYALGMIRDCPDCPVAGRTAAIEEANAPEPAPCECEGWGTVYEPGEGYVPCACPAAIIDERARKDAACRHRNLDPVAAEITGGNCWRGLDCGAADCA